MTAPEMGALQPIASEIEAAIRVIRPQGPLLLVGIDPGREGNNTVGQTFVMPSGLAAAARWAAATNARGLNVYFTANVARSLNKKPRKSEMLHAAYCWTDADPNVFAFRSYERAREHLLEHLAPKLCETASIVIDSGNGVQAFWRLSEQVVLPDLQDRFEHVNHAVGAAFSGPGTQNSDRVMRLPGTVNYKSPSKIKKGYPAAPSMSRLIYASDRAYTLEQIENLVSGERLRQRFDDFLLRTPKARARYDGDRTNLSDASGSGMDMSMVSMLKIGGFTAGETRALLEDWPHGSEGGRTQGERYWDRMWQNAKVDTPAQEPAQAAPGVQPGQEPPAPSKPLIEPLSIAWTGLEPPQREWIVDHWIPAGVSSLFHGDGGTGKTRVALQIAIAVILGREICGMRPNKAGRVLFVSAEEDLESTRRILWEISVGLGLDAEDMRAVVDGLVVLDLTTQGSPILYGPAAFGQHGWTALGSAVLEHAHNGGYALALIDNATACYAGPGGEQSYVYAYVNGWRDALRPHGAPVHLMHEAKASQINKDRTHAYSGVAAWNNACRSRIGLWFDDNDPNARYMNRPKSNYTARSTDDLRLVWTSGAFVPEVRGGLIDKIRADGDVRQAVEIVRELLASDMGNISPNTRAGNNPVAVLKARGRELPMPTDRFWKAIDQAVKDGALVIETYKGANRLESKRIVLGASK